jgi:predicted RNA-binding Zn-ribbon protein involved in translation (DUF1610 family)
MTTGITGQSKFSCSKCGTEYSLKNEDFDFQAESGSERNMGVETQYVSDYEQSCDSCGQEIKITFEVWEYPVGVINYTTYTASGVSNVESEFSFICSDKEKSHDENSNRLLGVAAGGAILGASLGGPVGALIGGIIGGMLGSVNKSEKKGGKNG